MERFFLIFLILCVGCEKQSVLSDFESDGCSMFLDQSLINEDDWCACCYEHDIVYWMGGTEVERLKADQQLRDCVYLKTGSKELADLMYEGVRFGGSPYFFNWYRWGYGWGYERGYGPLTKDEQLQLRKKLAKIDPTYSQQVCE